MINFMDLEGLDEQQAENQRNTTRTARYLVLIIEFEGTVLVSRYILDCQLSWIPFFTFAKHRKR